MGNLLKYIQSATNTRVLFAV